MCTQSDLFARVAAFHSVLFAPESRISSNLFVIQTVELCPRIRHRARILVLTDKLIQKRAFLEKSLLSAH